MKHTNRMLGMLTASLMALSAVPAIPAQAADTVLKYEFEDGKTSGGKIYTEGWKGNTKEDGTGEEFDMTNFSGKGFSYLDQKNTTISVEVDVPKAGLYCMNICYCEAYDPNKKVQYLNINGVNQGEVNFPHNLKFEEHTAGVVMLPEGKSTIELKAYWGYCYYDYLTLTPAPESLSSLTPDAAPCNPKASDSAKRLYAYLRDQYGKHILAGQQEYCGEHNYNLYADPTNFIKDNEAEFDYIKEQTGKMPAVRGIDFLAYRTGSDWDDHAAERAAQWVTDYHGIATVTWHWNVPSDPDDQENAAFYVESANPKFTTFSISKALEEGTWENEQLLKDIDLIAKKFQILKDADAPVLFRPLHEAEGAWFWWGAEGAEPCKKLYRLMYDKLTNEYGLDNILWVWTSSSYETAYDWYPGDDVVDFIGCDKYNCTDGQPNLSSISSTFYSLVQLTDGHKMVTMSENDSIPSLDNLVNEKAAWSWFCPWYQNYLMSEQNNPVDSLKEIYTSDYCITLDELPDLKTYPLSGSSDPNPTEPKTTELKPTEASTEVTSVTEETNATAPAKSGSCGDVNGDGAIDIIDVMALNKYLLGLSKLDADAQKRCDTDASGKIESGDALQLLKYVVEIVKELPVKK